MLNGKFGVGAGLPASLGPIAQICFITNDIPASVSHWSKIFGAGPFFHLEHIELLDTKYHGVPTNIDQSAALGYWGDIQIELIHQHNDAESVFTDWKTGKRSGLHHVLVHSPDLEITRSDLARVGGVVAQEARIGLGGEYIFVDLNSPDIPFVEVVRLDPSFNDLFAFMQRAAVDWDGSAPLRAVPDISEWK